MGCERSQQQVTYRLIDAPLPSERMAFLPIALKLPARAGEILRIMTLLRPFTNSLSALLFASAAASAATPPTLSVVRVWNPLLPELAGLADLDGDGREELVVRESQRMSAEILRADAADPRGYEVVGRIAGTSNIEWVRAIDLDADGSAELCVRYFNIGFRILDGATLQERRVLSSQVTDIDVGDVDGDQQPEVVIREGSVFRLLDPHTLQVRASFSAPYGDSFELGDVLGDEREEVVLREGIALQVSGTGPTVAATTVWTNANAPLERFVLNDTDADGKDEIVNSSYFGGVGIHRVTPASSFSQIAPYDVSYAAWFGDVDGDGALDVVTAASGGHGVIVAVDLQGNELWQIPRIFNRNHTALAVANVDASGSKALVWNSNDAIYVEPLPGGSGTPWHTLNPEALTASTFLPAPQGPTVLAMLSTGVQTGQQDQTVALWSGEAMADAGGSTDRWLAAPVSFPRATYQGAIAAIDSAAFPNEALALLGAESSPTNANDPVNARIWIMDRSARPVRSVDIPSNAQISAAQRYRKPGESQPHLVALDGPTNGTASLLVVGVQDGVPVWQSMSFAAQFRAFDPLVVEDLNADGNPEIVVVTDGTALIFDPTVGTAPIAQRTQVLGAATFRSQPGANAELVLSRAGGVIDIYSGLSPTPSRSLALSYDAYEMAAFVEPGTGRHVLVSLQDSNKVNAHDFESGDLIASTHVSGVYFPSSRIEVSDVEGDRTMEISVAGQDQVVLRLSILGVFGSGFEGSTPP